MKSARTPAAAHLALLAFCLPAARAQEGPQGDTLAGALARAAANRAQIERALAAFEGPRRAGMEFLVNAMPEPDLRSLSADFLIENVRLAYEMRARAPWGSSIPEAIFRDAVLPYANVTEPRHPWRAEFRKRFWPLVRECKSAAAAAQVLNRKIFTLVGVEYSTRRKRADQSPRESISSGLASCTGLSILLADACRAVAIPARLAGIPRWVNKRGNHTWVEIWDGRWHFTGAAEPDERGLDHAWFQRDAALARAGSRWNAIYAVSYGASELSFPMVWAPEVRWVHAVDVSARYAAPSPAGAGTTRLMIDVRDGAEGPRITAAVTLVDRANPERVLRGTSKGEKADTNDHLSFEVPRGSTLAVRVEKGGHSLELEHRCKRAEQELVVIHFPRDELEEALRAFFEADAEKRAAWRFEERFERRLLEDEEAVRRSAWKAFRTASIHAEQRRDFEQRRVRSGGCTSPYTLRAVGTKPAGGWPLFIALHGGGGVPKEVNDRGWRVMQHYYRDQPTVPGYLYLALRAPNDRWNGFYDDYVYPLIEELIRQQLLFAEVDPNKVFLMGYSHGGYGAFAIGPKIPDRFAAIHSSAAAPTDGECAARNLRNTVFSFMIGERDHAYGRVERCRAFERAIRALRGERTDIYPVTMELMAGYGHGGLPDRDKIRTMYAAVRRPVPRALSWELTDRVVRRFFWLGVTAPEKGCTIEAAWSGNSLQLETSHLARISIFFDGRLVNLAQPIEIRTGKRVRSHAPRPSLRTLCTTLAERGDPFLAFSARFDLDLGKQGR